MGKTYQHMLEFQNAIKCFKKQLQLAWLIGGTIGEESEMQAYEGLSLQYFYLGDTEKCQYYNDRMMKGKFEAKFSILRKMYTRIHNIKRSNNNQTNTEGTETIGSEEGGESSHSPLKSKTSGPVRS
jgi:hypothetical protein